jgi:predicted DsbA family dithiol-disulfide isomerase
MIHKAVKELKGFNVVHVNLPLDMECNSHLSSPFHEGSCRMARYSMAAEKQGKLWDMDAKFFEKHPASDEEILAIAEKVGLDINKLKEDANSAEIFDAVKKSVDDAYASEINATPTMVINGKKHVGMMAYSELKKLLEENGAKSR